MSAATAASASTASAAQIWVRGPVAAHARPDDAAPEHSGPQGHPASQRHPAAVVCWTSAHGGAGATTLARAVGGVDRGRRWPDIERGDPARVLLVARTHASGLRAASRALNALRTGRHPPGVKLVALVLVADAPGRLPLRLGRRVRVLRSAVPTVRVPWVPAWRLGETVQNPPRELADIAALIEPRPRTTRARTRTKGAPS